MKERENWHWGVLWRKGQAKDEAAGMNWEQRQIQTTGFIFMLVRALLIMPAVLLKAGVSLLFDAPGSDDNVPVSAPTYRWFLLPFSLRLQRAAICQTS
jgi:hypothetical protein